MVEVMREVLRKEIPWNEANLVRHFVETLRYTNEYYNNRGFSIVFYMKYSATEYKKVC